MRHPGTLKICLLPVLHVKLSLEAAAAFLILLASARRYGASRARLLVRRSLFEEVGGFVESLPLNFNDVDFCLKLAAAGYRCVVTPAARLHHFESSTRTAEVLPWEKDSLRWWRPRTIPDPNLQIRGTG